MKKTKSITIALAVHDGFFCYAV